MAAQNKGTILITGGGGFVGGQIIREALESGFSVRLTARSASSAARTVARFPSFASALSTAIVPDMTAPEAYESAFADGAVITHVVHSASPFNLAPRDNVRELLDPAVRGATAILEAALRYGGGKVKRVVATSSFAAVIDLSKGLREGYSYDEKDWNPVTWDEAAVANGVVAYCASKALAEKAMWDWMGEHKDEVSFGLATICPPWVFGPYAHELRDTRGLSESVQLLNGIIDGDAIPAFDFGGYADSREVAAAHVRALEVPEAEGKRFVVGQDFRYQAAVDIAREEDPELARRMPVGKTGEWIPAYHVDGSLATRVLGLKYGSLRDTVMDTYRQLLKARKAEADAA